MIPVLQTILGDRPIRRFSPYIFGILIVGLTLHPYVLQAIVHSAWLPYVEGAMNLLIVAFGVLTYYLYERERREYDQKFLESSIYIGAMNRKLPLLQQVTTDIVSGKITTAKQKAEAFQKLIGIAVGSIAQSDRGLLRFIEVKTGRTVKEFHYTLGDKQSDRTFTVGNRELLTVVNGTTEKLTRRLIVTASDRAARIRAFLVIPHARTYVSEDMGILQAVVDQGQMLFRYTFGDSLLYA